MYTRLELTVPSAVTEEAPFFLFLYGISLLPFFFQLTKVEQIFPFHVNYAAYLEQV